MPRAPLTRDSLKSHCARLRTLDPDDTAKWGKLTPAGMLCHLRTTLEISLGKHEFPDTSNVFTRTALKWIVFHMPWPKGKVKAPDNFTPQPDEDVRGERERLLVCIEEFLNLLESSPDQRTLHPAFGSLKLAQWARLHGLHFNHHLTQFGR